MIISITEKHRKKEKSRNTRPTTDFQPLHIIALINNQNDLISVIHLQKFLRINRGLDVDILMNVSF